MYLATETMRSYKPVTCVVGLYDYNLHKKEVISILKSIPKPPEPAEDLPRLVYCKHGLIECCCGVCTKHPLSVAVKGGHVVGTSSGTPNITNPAFGCYR